MEVDALPGFSGNQNYLMKLKPFEFGRSYKVD